MVRPMKIMYLTPLQGPDGEASHDYEASRRQVERERGKMKEVWEQTGIQIICPLSPAGEIRDEARKSLVLWRLRHH